MTARVVGGFQILDQGEADDKVVAVLSRDPVWGEVAEMAELPLALVDRLAHYFETYKELRDQPDVITLQERYGAEHASRLIEAAQRDYQKHYPKGT